MKEKADTVLNIPFIKEKIDEMVDECISRSPMPQNSLLPEEALREKQRQDLHELIHSQEFEASLTQGVDTLVTFIDESQNPENYQVILENFSKIGSLITTKEHFSSHIELEALQIHLGLSDLCMQKLYSIATDLFEKAEYEKSSHILSLLTILNPLVFAYWLTSALSFIHQNLMQEALTSLAVSILLDPEDPAPRIFSAECYLVINDLESAEKELYVADRLISSGQSHPWEEPLNELKEKILKRS